MDFESRAFGACCLRRCSVYSKGNVGRNVSDNSLQIFAIRRIRNKVFIRLYLRDLLIRGGGLLFKQGLTFIIEKEENSAMKNLFLR